MISLYIILVGECILLVCVVISYNVVCCPCGNRNMFMIFRIVSKDCTSSCSSVDRDISFLFPDTCRGLILALDLVEVRTPFSLCMLLQ